MSGVSDERAEAGALGARLDAIWERRLPAVVARIALIEDAVGAPEGDLPAARTEAHKLRGLLGTLGVGAGSEIAGRIETDLERLIGGDAGPELPARVLGLCGELRDAVGARRPGSEDD